MNRKGAADSKELQLQVGQKALKGEPHEHSKHEIRLGRLENVERYEGNQTLEVFVMSVASLIQGNFPTIMCFRG